MAIPSVIQGTFQTEGGKVLELDSPKGLTWLESIGSFRFEPSRGGKPYTVRRESGIYWYGCRKVAGKVRKKYIGKSSEVTVAKLEEIAEALEIPPVPRANKVAQDITEVAEVAEVTEVAQRVAQDRLTALELQVTNLQKAVEALQEALPGKLEAGDSLELPKIDNEVADERLQNELGNLKAENEKLRADYAALLESSTHVTNKLRVEVQELRSQLEQERAYKKDVEDECWEKEESLNQTRAELLNREKELAVALAEVLDLKQKSAPGVELPEAADLLNQLKAKRKKSKTDLGDIETILQMIEEF